MIGFDLLTRVQLILIGALSFAILLVIDIESRWPKGFECEADMMAVAVGIADCAGLDHSRLPLLGG